LDVCLVYFIMMFACLFFYFYVWLVFGLATGFGSIRSGLEIGNAGSVYFL
jgi:hypothetical protein